MGSGTVSRRRAAAVTHGFDVPAERVWEAMATPGALARYHPFCVENPVVSWPGVDSRDTIRYLSGLRLHRRFTAWEEGRGYELEIGNSRIGTSRVRWELVPVGAEESKLTIRIWPAALPGYPAGLQWALRRWYLLPVLRRYLRSVLRGLDHYLTTGADVEPNQFGRVRLFS